MTPGHTAPSAPRRVPFELTMPLPTGRTVLEASAGTGKTYSLTALIVRYIAESNVAVDQLLVVTFTRAAANELRDRARAALTLASQFLETRTGPEETTSWMSALAGDGVTDLEREQRWRRVLDAIARFDDLTITTIHGFCQQAITQLGLRASGNPHAVLVENTNNIVAEVCRDVIITQLAEDPLRLSPSASADKVLGPRQVEAQLIAAVNTVLSNPGAVLVPSASITMTSDPATEALAQRWSQLVADTCVAVQQRQQARGEIGYDASISGLRDALTDPDRGPVVAEQLAQRYAVVLVDEFQDTDRVQWQVFKTAFASRVLVTVGDPKQAIYRFRGADVHAYLNAADEPVVYSLATNHRSDQQLLGGLEHLLNGAQLGDPRIQFLPVKAAERAPFNALGAEAPIQLRAITPHASLFTSKSQTVAMPKARQLILSDLVARVIQLLDHNSITTPTNALSSDRANDGIVTRRIQPGDIAILVPTHSEADAVATTLRRSGIPAVRTRTGSVLKTTAVLQWRLLLTALARPFHAPSVRGAALGWFLQTDPSALCGDHADTVLADLQERVATMAQRLHRVGLASFYDEEKSGSGLLQTLLALDEGERHLTDLDHVAELLTGVLPAGSEPGQTLRILDELVANDDDRSEATMRRIDSDALAVQITTIHSAKGLEYPIVLLPFGFKKARGVSKPLTYTGPTDLRTIDVASLVPWDEGPLDPSDKASARDQKARERQARADVDGDELRLLYVALTRAKHRLEVWWASTDGASSSALARVLLDRDGGDPIQNSRLHLVVGPRGGVSTDKPAFVQMDPNAIIAELHRLAISSKGSISLTELPHQLPKTTWTPVEVVPAHPLNTAATNGRGSLVDHAWRRWSFTRLTSVLDTHDGDHAATLETPVPAVRGGADEPSSTDDGVVSITESAPLSSRPVGATGVVAHLADAAAGTTFGTFVHSVLEELDFTSSDLVADLEERLAHNALREGLRVNTTELALGLAAALRTPLGPLFDQLSLADIAPADRLAELTFDVPLAPALSNTGASLPVRSIADVLLRTLDSVDPLRPFAAQLASEAAHINIAGWMNGSIDAVVRIPRGSAHTYLVIDYKTNRLHTQGGADPVAAYSPHHLVTAMEQHRYPLQALLYSVAVHRYLRWRLGSAYNPDQHLGGIGYLFVRGMVGAHTPVVDGVPHGVFSWRPATATIVALDTLFATGSFL